MEDLSFKENFDKGGLRNKEAEVNPFQNNQNMSDSSMNSAMISQHNLKECLINSENVSQEIPNFGSKEDR